jgi:hypothetical protein
MFCSKEEVSHHTFLTEKVFMFAIKEISGFLYGLKDCANTTVDII